jgi:hypothetical protein
MIPGYSWRDGYLRQTGGALWRKDALLAVGGWKEDQPCCQEHELYLRLMMAGKRFVYSADEGAIYRQLQGSVSTRDISEVHRQRLQIEAQAEDFLRRTIPTYCGSLEAINDARFEIARAVGVYDTSFASEIAETIVDSQPDSSQTDTPRRSLTKLLIGLWDLARLNDSRN